MTTVRLRLAGTLLALATALAGPSARGQEPEYMLLFNRFGELCTMCEAMVACRAGSEPPAATAALGAPGAPWTLYHFQTKTFWGQVATIWKYLVRWVSPIVQEERPVVVYMSGPGGGRRETLAQLSVEPPRIVVDDRRIDRTTSTWQTLAGESVGRCARLPLRETLAWLKTGAPGTAEARSTP